jgi:lipopolysaccharide transport system ATP-binding protein
MTQSVIRAYNLSKKYKLGATLSHDTLRDRLACGARSLWQRAKGNGQPSKDECPGATEETCDPDEIWALKGVSLDVTQGEVLGIVGRNGAGKSTLLKLLSQITEPTEGEIFIRGRVASLLEVGTGFHPELTGRENIYLNGAILGMTRSEIRKKFDEIVAFAEVNRFIDTPVKRYSSGMYVRLAFAVAAHLEPEILLVDEVLAVGDEAFKNKCFNKMEDVAGEGRTVLVVSHNMGAIRQMADRAILLEHGRVKEDGSVERAIEGYFGITQASAREDLRDFPDRGGNGSARILSVSLHSADGGPVETVMPGESMVVRYTVDFKEPVNNPLFQLLIESASGEPLLDLRSSQWGLHTGTLNGTSTVQVTIESLPLAPGQYILSPCVMDRSETYDLDYVRRSILLRVMDGSPYPSGVSVNPKKCRFILQNRWKQIHG